MGHLIVQIVCDFYQRSISTVPLDARFELEAITPSDAQRVGVVWCAGAQAQGPLGDGKGADSSLAVCTDIGMPSSCS